MLKFFTPEESELIPYEFDARRMWNTQTLEIVRLVIPTDKSMNLHDNPSDVIFYLMQGSGELIMEDQTYQLSAESCTEVKTGTNRAWRNTGNTDLIVLVIKLM
jgi:mannose-6-phosphate isomerase-like protein (cupin superfamily)